MLNSTNYKSTLVCLTCNNSKEKKRTLFEANGYKSNQKDFLVSVQLKHFSGRWSTFVAGTTLKPNMENKLINVLTSLAIDQLGFQRRTFWTCWCGEWWISSADSPTLGLTYFGLLTWHQRASGMTHLASGESTLQNESVFGFLSYHVCFCQTSCLVLADLEDSSFNCWDLPSINGVMVESTRMLNSGEVGLVSGAQLHRWNITSEMDFVPGSPWSQSALWTG